MNIVPTCILQSREITLMTIFLQKRLSTCYVHFKLTMCIFFSIHNDLTALNYVTTTILVTYVIIYMRLQNITLLVY